MLTRSPVNHRAYPSALTKQPLPTNQYCNLDEAASKAIASLIAIGCQSGDSVMGLSAIRRTSSLAFVFAATNIATGTWEELIRLHHTGTHVFRVTDLTLITAMAGRTDLSVIAVKSGSLADGIASKLATVE